MSLRDILIEVISLSWSIKIHFSNKRSTNDCSLEFYIYIRWCFCCFTHPHNKKKETKRKRGEKMREREREREYDLIIFSCARLCRFVCLVFLFPLLSFSSMIVKNDLSYAVCVYIYISILFSSMRLLFYRYLKSTCLFVLI